jgi:hypothetical protein
MRVALLSVVVVLALAGCKAAPAPYSQTEERPRVAAEARYWELQGDIEIERAWRTDSLRMRELHFDIAVGHFVHARSLYYEELEALENAESTDIDRMRPYPGIRWAQNGPIPAGRREALEIEINRLSDEIHDLVIERPIEPPPERTITQKMFPLNDRAPTR